LLLSSKGGLGNSSGTLGHYMMDQVGGGGITGYLPRLKGAPSRLDDGKSAGISVPAFKNIDKKTAQKDFIRSYVMNATGGQTEFPQYAASLPGYGSDWKREVRSRFVAQARVWIAGGEMLARKENRVELDPEVKDKWGIPVLKIHFTHSDNDRKLLADFQQTAEEWFHRAGGEPMNGLTKQPAGFPGGSGSPDADRKEGIGGSIHEVGTARMSASPKDGVLDPYCRMHDVPNIFVFGGNAFCSTGDKHPTLTMMALTVRGCESLKNPI
jgi:choline dehydrogenase-like flavoprotein